MAGLISAPCCRCRCSENHLDACFLIRIPSAEGEEVAAGSAVTFKIGNATCEQCIARGSLQRKKRKHDEAGAVNEHEEAPGGGPGGLLALAAAAAVLEAADGGGGDADGEAAEAGGMGGEAGDAVMAPVGGDEEPVEGGLGEEDEVPRVAGVPWSFHDKETKAGSRYARLVCLSAGRRDGWR